MSVSQPRDLVIVVADKNAESAIKGICARHQSLGIPPLVPRVLVHPEKDPGCLRHGHDLLRPFVNQYVHGLIIFDREGCGRDREPREQLEEAVETCLARDGWGGRAVAVVIDPELENSVWSRSPHVAEALGWGGRGAALAQWLANHNWLTGADGKPARPKEAMEAALRVVRVPHSAAIFLRIAQKVSFDGCNDPSFLKFRATLTDWFARATS